jgi:sulfite reductase (NADPH) flavoprotein alpha-component
MAPDVHEALLAIVAREGGMSHEQADEYIKRLQHEKRYQRDVY